MVSQSVENSAKMNARKTRKQERVRFTFEPGRSSPNGITFTWLIHDAYEGKEKAAMAVRSFWLPIAYQQSGQYSKTELNQLAQDCVWQLEAQIQLLRSRFNLTDSQQPQSIIHPTYNQSKPPLQSESHSIFLKASSTSDTVLLDELIEVLN